MSIIPYNNFNVIDLSNVQQPYVNSCTEFGYFNGTNLGIISKDRWYSLPAVLNTRNGIARVDANGVILQAGIYKINLSLFPTSTQDGSSNITFNFGTRYLFNEPSTNIVNAFGGVEPIGMFTYDPSNNPYSPGIISWLANGYDSSNNTISNFIKNPITNELSQNYGNTGYPSRSLYSSIFTTKMTFILDSSASIYFNVSTNSNTGVNMGNSCFTLSLISSPFTVPVKTWRWTKTTAVNRTWKAIAMSDNGQYIAAIPTDGYINMSKNYGATWGQRMATGFLSWKSITSSASGQYLAAVSTPGFIWRSINYGDNWQSVAVSGNWTTISSSSDGSKLAAAGTGTRVHVSTDYGASWGQLASSPLNLTSITISDSGQYLAAVLSETARYVSTNFGQNWSTTNLVRNFNSIASSIDGKYVAISIGAFEFLLSLSSNFASSFLEIAPLGLVQPNWTGIASSYNGQCLLVCGSGSLIIASRDYGATWIQQTTGLPANLGFQNITLSGDGTKAATLAYDEGIYIGQYS